MLGGSQASLESSHVIAQAVHRGTKTFGFVAAGYCMAFFLQVFTDILAQGGTSLLAPLSYSTPEYAEVVRRRIAY